MEVNYQALLIGLACIAIIVFVVVTLTKKQPPPPPPVPTPVPVEKPIIVKQFIERTEDPIYYRPRLWYGGWRRRW